MRVLLDIRDNKTPFVMKLLQNLPFVKTKIITEPNPEFLKEVKIIKKAFKNADFIKAGKLKTRSAEDLLNGL